MADVKWIKIVTDIFDDEKILLIESLPEADSIIVIWFKLLCLAGKQNNSGVFTLNGKIPYTDKMLATIFRRKESTVQMALHTFEQFGMIEIVDDVITIPNWGKHQSIDYLSDRRDYMRGYMADYRQKQKLLVDGKEDCKTNSKVNSKPNGKVSVKPVNPQEEIRLDKNRSDIDNKKNGAFAPPSLQEVSDYCNERSNGINPNQWYDFYSAKGWMVGKNKMKDWKAAVRTWENRDKGVKPTGNNRSNTKQSAESERFNNRPL